MPRLDYFNRRQASTLSAICRLRLLLAGVALALTGCGVDSPAFGIYTSDLGATPPKLIAAVEGRPVWSPIGDAIAWGNEDGLFVLESNVADSAPRMVLGKPVAAVPAWSPSGDRIAVTTREGSLTVIGLLEETALFSLPIETNDAPRPPVAALAMGGPAWSPSGDSIAYVCWDGAGDEICLVNADGGEPRLLTRINGETQGGAGAAGVVKAAANVGPASWSPDGQQLAAAVYGERRGAPNGLFVIDPAAGSAEKVSELAPNSPVLWTAGGAALVFSATRNGRSDAFRLWLDTGEAELLTSELTQGARNPALDSDGNRLAVESGGRVFVLDLARANSAPIAIDTAGGDAFPAWNSDGTAIAFTASPDPIASYP